MPRKTRMYVAGYPTHVVQRGHNKSPTFFGYPDYLLYKDALAEGLRRYGVCLHAYCLMTNHVHLLLTPEAPDSVPRLMQHVGRRYVAVINAERGRSGALWEGRHRNSLVDSGRYLIAAYRYIERNPVAAGLVRRPDEYPWSSFGANGLGRADALVTPHAEYLALGSDRAHAQVAYRRLVAMPSRDEEIVEIRSTLNASYPFGSHAFRERVGQALGRSVGQLARGGPRQAGQKASTTTP